MADFCKQCSKSIFGPSSEGDFVGDTSREDWAQGKAVVVLCEGCGPIQVDPDGNCVSKDCMQNGHPAVIAGENR